MKTNHDGTITLNAYDTWTACAACGQRVTGDSIHTCSPQLKPLSDEEHYKNKAEYLDKRELELLAEIARLEKDLHMVQRHYDQVNLPDGYVVVCVHCAKELKIEFDEPTDLEAKMTKYEQVLQSIANEQVELSHDKIKWQCEDHIRWAKEALK